MPGGGLMGSAGSDGPTVAFRIVIEHAEGETVTVDAVVEALQACRGAFYVEVHEAEDPCEEVGHLSNGYSCPRCEHNRCDDGLPRCDGLFFAHSPETPCQHCGRNRGSHPGAVQTEQDGAA